MIIERDGKEIKLKRDPNREELRPIYEALVNKFGDVEEVRTGEIFKYIADVLDRVLMKGEAVTQEEINAVEAFLELKRRGLRSVLYKVYKLVEERHFLERGSRRAAIA